MLALRDTMPKPPAPMLAAESGPIYAMPLRPVPMPAAESPATPTRTVPMYVELSPRATRSVHVSAAESSNMSPTMRAMTMAVLNAIRMHSDAALVEQVDARCRRCEEMEDWADAHSDDEDDRLLELRMSVTVMRERSAAPRPCHAARGTRYNFICWCRTAQRSLQ